MSPDVQFILIVLGIFLALPFVLVAIAWVVKGFAAYGQWVIDTLYNNVVHRGPPRGRQPRPEPESKGEPR